MCAAWSGSVAGGWFGNGMYTLVPGIIFWCLVIFGGFVVVKMLFAKSGGIPGKDSVRSPLDIIKERYAKGEMTREEFERMKHEVL